MPTGGSLSHWSLHMSKIISWKHKKKSGFSLDMLNK